VLNKHTVVIIVINSGNSDKQVGLYSGVLLFGGGLPFGGLRHTFYSIVLFVFSINRIRQNASHTNLLVYLGII
jgi:hypothetical protein